MSAAVARLTRLTRKLAASRTLRSIVTCAWLVGCGAASSTKNPDDALDALPPSGDLGVVTPDSTGAKRGPNAPARGTGRGPTARETSVIAELMRAAERVRALRFEHDVPVLIEDRERITAYVERQIDDEELERARIVYTAIGLLAPGLDIKELLLRVMGEQIVGYYDADDKRLVVRDDVMRAFTRARAQAREREGFDGTNEGSEHAGGSDESEESGDLTEARIVLVHELVHALQDQNLALSEHIELERSTDADNAFHALVEGDATLAMIGYALEGEQIPLRKLTSNPAQVRSFSDVVRHSPLAGSELEQSPPIVRVPLLSAYVDGLAFCASLHGATGWAGVDRAHTAPPISTEQVLHPERFARGDQPEPITLPVIASIDAAGYKQVEEDTLGELEMGVYFGQGESQDDARRDADGWDGDRLRVYENAEKHTAVLWVSAWDSEHDAEEAASAAQRVHDKLAPEARARAEVLRRGQALMVLRDLPDALRALLRARFSAAGLAAEGAASRALPSAPR